jgi:hypothetical protein
MRYQRAGGAMIAFGVALLIIPLLFGVCTVDFVAIGLIALGSSVRRGSRNSAGWGIALMAFYAFFGALMLLLPTAISVRISISGIGGHGATSPEKFWIRVILVGLIGWAIYTIVLLRDCRRFQPWKLVEGADSPSDDVAR